MSHRFNLSGPLLPRPSQMEHISSRKWRILLTTATFLAILTLLACTYYRKLNFDETWNSQEPAAGTGSNLDPNLGHEPVVRPPTDQNDISIRLYPEHHIHRKPRMIELYWNITKGRRRPDGVAKETYLINGDFPGPAVESRSGDKLIVIVHNGLSNESTSIHWHGLRIANGMDGVVGVTQCAIAPGQSFRYELALREDQSGTFWYHAHSETQRADGLFGPLIVHDPSTRHEPGYGPVDDQVLLIGDWYHHEAAEVLDSYTDRQNSEAEPVPDSLLLNGKGYFECSRATRARPVDCINHAVPHVTLSERTRLRIVNVGALTGFTISVVGYKIKLIQVDGGSRVETVVSSKIGILYPGERMDLILEQQSLPHAWITVSLDRENLRSRNLALIDTQQFPVAMSMEAVKQVAHAQSRGIPEEVGWVDLSNVRRTVQGTPPPLAADETILLYTGISYLSQNEYRPRGFVNDSSWTPSSQELPLLALERSEWLRDANPTVTKVQRDHWIQLVINNLDDKGHPFHLHGHAFYVLRSFAPERPGAFNQYNPFHEDDHSVRNQLNFQTSLLKDTVYVPSMGYVVLTFRASNPGLWLLHCHVLWHGAIGMNIAIQVGDDADDAQREAASAACGS